MAREKTAKVTRIDLSVWPYRMQKGGRTKLFVTMDQIVNSAKDEEERELYKAIQALGLEQQSLQMEVTDVRR